MRNSGVWGGESAIRESGVGRSEKIAIRNSGGDMKKVLKIFSRYLYPRGSILPDSISPVFILPCFIRKGGIPMVTKIVHVDTQVTERLCKAFKKAVALNGSTQKQTVAELIARYVKENSDRSAADKR